MLANPVGPPWPLLAHCTLLIHLSLLNWIFTQLTHAQDYLIGETKLHMKLGYII